MKKFKVFLLSILASVLFFSCASTKLSSFSEIDGSVTNSSKVVVFGNTSDVALRKTIEKDFVAAFEAKKINVASAIDILSPLKEFTDEEYDAAMRMINATHILTVTLPADGFYPYPNVNYEVTITNYKTGELIYRATGVTESDKAPELKGTSAYLAKAVCADFAKLNRRVDKSKFVEEDDEVLPEEDAEDLEAETDDSESEDSDEVESAEEDENENTK